MRSKFKWIFTLLVAFSMQFSFAQQKTVTGVVSDDFGPISGANVVVKGTTRGTMTDFDGKYTIAASKGEVLVISYVGKEDVAVTVGAGNNYDVVLKTVELSTIVVEGALGIKRKADEVTSTYQTVNNAELRQAANPNAVQALVGKVSGLQINATSSGVNSSNRVVFRGIRSITGNNEALVVIDGAISSLATLQQLPPEIIESVNALKGAQGSALYGSDGVNGVIIVTTTKGKDGEKFSVSLNSSVDISSIAYLPQRQLRYGQGWDGVHSNYENGSWGPEFDGSLQPTGLMQADGSFFMLPYSPIKDNYKAFFKNGAVYQNGLTISGGSLDSGYVTLAINNQQSDFVVDGDMLKRTSVLFKGGKKLGKATVEGDFFYLKQDVEQSEAGLYGNLLQTASNIPVDRFDGTNEHHWNIYYNSPYWMRDNQRSFSDTDKFVGNIRLGYQFNKNISVRYLANLRLTTGDSYSYRNQYDDVTSSLYGARSKSVQSRFFTSTELDRRFYADLVFNFDYDLTEDISFKANVGNNMQDRYYKINQVGGTDLEVENLYNYTNVLNPALPNGVSNSYSHSNKAGFFANVDLGYKDYLFLNATGRYDISSVFSKDNNGYFYPSFGVSFIPTKAFDIQSNVLSSAKLFANWTRVGNDSALSAYSINQLGALGIGYAFGGANSYVMTNTVTNPEIKPEFVTTKEIGGNFEFFKKRVTLDGSYYVSDTDDMITVSTASSAVGGFTRLRDNTGSLQTKGFEIDLGFTPIKSEDPRGFRWDARLSYTHYETKVTKINNGSTQVALRQPYDFVGIFAEEGEEFPLIKGSTYLRDDYGRVIVDANGLPTIDPELKKLGKVNPDYILGFNTAFSYKGVKLSTTMDFRTGHQFYSDVKRNLSWTGQTIESAENRGGFILPNSSFDYNGNGAYEADEANTNVLTGGTISSLVNDYYGGRYSVTGENLVLDATAFKVREVALSYTFPNSIIDHLHLSSLVIGVNARNPFTWFPKQNRYYADPEAGENTDNAGQGLAFTDRYPVQKTYGFSINVSF